MDYSYLDLLAHFGVGGAHPGGIELTRQFLSPERLDRSTLLLDAGCGTGQSSAFIKNEYGCSVIAFDINPLMLEKAKHRFEIAGLPIPTLRGDVEDLPFEDGHFDMILSESVLAFTDTARSLPEITRVLKEDGLLLAVEMVVEKTDAEDELLVAADFYGFKTVLTEEEWIQRFMEAGFSHTESVPFQGEALQGGESADFQLSRDIDGDLIAKFHQHQMLSASHSEILGFRMFRCGRMPSQGDRR